MLNMSREQRYAVVSHFRRAKMDESNYHVVNVVIKMITRQTFVKLNASVPSRVCVGQCVP